MQSLYWSTMYTKLGGIRCDKCIIDMTISCAWLVHYNVLACQQTLHFIFKMSDIVSKAHIMLYASQFEDTYVEDHEVL